MSQIQSDPRQILDSQAAAAFDKEATARTNDWIKQTINRYASKKARSAHVIFGSRWRSSTLFRILVIQCKQGEDVFSTVKMLAIYVIWHIEKRRDAVEMPDWPVVEVYSYLACRATFCKSVADESILSSPEFETVNFKDKKCEGYGNLMLAILAKCGLLKQIRMQTLRSDLARATELAGDTTISYEELPDLLEEVCEHLDSMFKSDPPRNASDGNL